MGLDIEIYGMDSVHFCRQVLAAAKAEIKYVEHPTADSSI